MEAIPVPPPLPLKEWMPLHQGKLFIAGPCSVESRSQLATTAKEIASNGIVKVLRAGIWKPRSRPGKFEGIGEKALPWLSEISNETGMLTAVEVARPDHVHHCLKHKVDILWLGARTTVNPFMVQEIADAIKGSDVAVMIKNPVTPDLRLWIGAIERILLAGTQKIIAIHRGFYSHHQTLYRNPPLWEIPLELKKEWPFLPLICDPSHIAGNRQYLTEVAVQALQLSMDGLIIEVHHQPDKALTDPFQQLSPAELDELLHLLLSNITDAEYQQPLDHLRRKIDDNDMQLLAQLGSRMQLVQEIGVLKKKQDEAIVQPERQQQLIADRLSKARALGLRPLFVEKLFTLLHREAVTIQTKTTKGNKPDR